MLKHLETLRRICKHKIVKFMIFSSILLSFLIESYMQSHAVGAEAGRWVGLVGTLLWATEE